MHLFGVTIYLLASSSLANRASSSVGISCDEFILSSSDEACGEGGSILLAWLLFWVVWCTVVHKHSTLITCGPLRGNPSCPAAWYSCPLKTNTTGQIIWSEQHNDSSLGMYLSWFIFSDVSCTFCERNSILFYIILSHPMLFAIPCSFHEQKSKITTEGKAYD